MAEQATAKTIMMKMILPISLKECLQSQRVLVAFTATLSFMVASTHGLHAQTGQAAADPNKQVSLSLEDVDIRVLINTVAEVSGKNFIIDPRVKGKVQVVSGRPLNSEDLYNFFLSILEVHNFAAVDSGDAIKILPSNVIKQRPTPTLFQPTSDTNDSQITQIIKLTNASVQELVPIIRPLIPPTSHFAPHPPSNSVVLTDTAANIQRILKIIKRIDIPDERSNTRIVYLNKAKASDLANTLTQLMTASLDPKAAASAPKAIIQPFDAINALAIDATDSQYAKIQALIDELDIERELQSDINVIYLKHAKAEDLVSILNDVTATQTEGAVSDFSVQADEATNSLIVKASGNQLKSVTSVVDKLDRRRAQVFVETVIAEVSLDQSANIGVNWGAGGGTTTTGAPNPDGTPGTSTTIGNLVDEDSPLDRIGTASIATAFGLGTGGLTYSLLDFKKYQLDVIVNALRADTNSNILSTPTILTLDNESAEIVVGQEVPFVTGRFNNGFNNSTNVDGNGNSTGGTVGNSFQTIERKDVGIKLKIKPQISDGDTIQLEVLQEISSVAETAIDGQADLITNRRSIEAVVQVDDGQVVALGGLIQDDVIDTVNWVPVLGKLPIIGALFRSKSKTAVKRNLMVFLKPRIIRTADELAKYSKEKYDEIRRDGEISQAESSKFLIDDAAPPVLEEYELVQGDEVLGTERRRAKIEEAKAGEPPLKGVRRLIHKQIDKVFPHGDKRDSAKEYRTEGEIEVLDMPDKKSSKHMIQPLEKPIIDEDNIIEWGDSPPPPPATSVNEE